MKPTDFKLFDEMVAKFHLYEDTLLVTHKAIWTAVVNQSLLAFPDERDQLRNSHMSQSS